MNQTQVVTLDNKQDKHLKTCEYAGGHFKLTPKGVSFIGRNKDGNELPSRWICSPFHITAKTRDEKSGEWGRLLKWYDDDGVKHQWAMPLALLHGDGAEIRKELARLGLTISPSKRARDLLISYIQVFPLDRRARCVDKLGWHGDVFVTASGFIGQSSEAVVFQNTNAIEPALSVSGTVEAWRDSIARLAAGNSRLVFALSTAFAPTLAKIIGEDSGGFHLRGASSSGKTTALKIAASVWGEPNAYCRLWRTTSNGLEGLAALHNDGLLILDELSQMDPKQAGEAAYLLANGQGKTRASRHGTAKKSAKWSLFFLSAGEESLTALMARAGQRANAGQEIRLADIEADAGLNMGIFECLHDAPNPETMALNLKEAASRYYGAVGLAWLEKVVHHRQALSDIISKSIQDFIETLMLEGCSGQILRVARRFALVAAAGELATQYGLTGWDKGEAFYAAHKCFRTWLDAFGSHGHREGRVILSQVRAFFESHGSSRFDKLRAPNGEHINRRAGFYTTANNGDRNYMVLSEVFKNEVCEGFDYKVVGRVLLDAEWLMPGKDGRATQKIRVAGIGIPRLYVFNSRLWEEE
ncbi:MAG: DUF927 domain-containing protein [Legionella sp.]|nr:DUF927 domain-containing protein [Legionella sp.]